MDNRQDRELIKQMKEEVKQLSDSQQKFLLQLMLNFLIRDNKNMGLNASQLTEEDYILAMQFAVKEYLEKYKD